MSRSGATWVGLTLDCDGLRIRWNEEDDMGKRKEDHEGPYWVRMAGGERIEECQSVSSKPYYPAVVRIPARWYPSSFDSISDAEKRAEKLGCSYLIVRQDGKIVRSGNVGDIETPRLVSDVIRHNWIVTGQFSGAYTVTP